ncbi:MAG: DUF4956 domain-containing protein [Acidimicrobiales bacterium]
MPATELSGVAAALAVDVVAITLFAVLIFWRRHSKPGLTVVFCFFNLCLFAVVAVVQRSSAGLELGFGLFAMLSIIRLRSDPFSPREIGYCFGALVLGLINGIGTPDAFTITLNAVLVAAMFILDHPRLFVRLVSMEVTLDRVINGSSELRREIEQRLGRTVTEIEVRSVDYVRDLMEIKVTLPPTPTAPGQSGRPPRSNGERRVSSPRARQIRPLDPADDLDWIAALDGLPEGSVPAGSHQAGSDQSGSSRPGPAPKGPGPSASGPLPPEREPLFSSVAGRMPSASDLSRPRSPARPVRSGQPVDSPRHFEPVEDRADLSTSSERPEVERSNRHLVPAAGPARRSGPSIDGRRADCNGSDRDRDPR